MNDEDFKAVCRLVEDRFRIMRSLDMQQIKARSDGDEQMERELEPFVQLAEERLAQALEKRRQLSRRGRMPMLIPPIAAQTAA